VPVLELDDGTRIADAVAICLYFEASQPEPPLMGHDPRSRALVAAAQRRAEREGFYAVMEAFRNFTPGLKGRALPGAHDYEQIPALAERGRARVLRFFETMNAELAGRAFLRRRLQHRRHHHAGDGRFRQGGQAPDPGTLPASAPLARGGIGTPERLGVRRCGRSPPAFDPKAVIAREGGRPSTHGTLMWAPHTLYRWLRVYWVPRIRGA
jgi:hypothetical protein